MARTAKRYLDLQPDKERGEKLCRAGNYLRLSVDSDYTGSDSLENQRRLAREYADRASDIQIVKEYIDDGKTGTNFERPAFARMMADLRQGEIDCIIVKDLSRFGRAYTEAGSYIEKVFPFLGVRFISIVDRYDSSDPECDKELLLLSLKNLMHEMYAKDISKKVGSIYKIKQEKKVFYRSSTLPYGYKMDQAGKNYCIDEPAAEIVREIFAQYRKGTSKYVICQQLFEWQVLTPAQYRKTGRVFRGDGDELKIWHASSLERILKNPVYIGNVLRHKTEQSFFEGKKSSAVPDEERVLITENHPALITAEVFEEVQDRLGCMREEYAGYRSRSDVMKESKVFEGNIFQGKLFCGKCGANMIRRVGYHHVDGQEVRHKEYMCDTYNRLPAKCSPGRIEEKELCAILYAAIRKHLSLIKGMKKLVERDVRYSFEARMQKLEGEKQRIRNCKAITEQEYLEKYARYTAGTSSRETFQEFRRVYLEKMNSYQEQLEELDAEGKKVKRNIASIKNMFLTWSAVDGGRKLTEDMVNSCIERIDVFPDKRLEVKLRYHDCFDLLEKWVEGEKEA